MGLENFILENFIIDLIFHLPLLVIGIIGYIILRKIKKKNERDLEYIASIPEEECHIIKTVDSKTKLFAEPKKSIFYLNLEQGQQIIISGKKIIDGIEWNKVETEGGNKGWCVLP